MDIYVKEGQNVLVVWKKSMPEEFIKKHMDSIKNTINNGILQLENCQRLHIGEYQIYWFIIFF